jgi:hypothetical protein
MKKITRASVENIKGEIHYCEERYYKMKAETTDIKTTLMVSPPYHKIDIVKVFFKYPLDLFS